MKARKQNIHDRFDECVALANSYAEDGEFFSAARVLRDLADEFQAHGEFADKAVKALLADYDRRNGRPR